MYILHLVLKMIFKSDKEDKEQLFTVYNKGLEIKKTLWSVY